MKRTLRVTFFIAIAVNCTVAVPAQNKNAGGIESDDGKIYTERQVNKRARLTEKPDWKFFDEAAASCPNKKFTVRLRLVLSRSGKVSSVEVLEDESQCGVGQAMMKDVGRIRFTPAEKSGRAVSQYLELELKARPQKK